MAEFCALGEGVEGNVVIIADFIGGSNFLTGIVATVTGNVALVSLPDGQTLSVSPAGWYSPGIRENCALRHSKRATESTCR